MKLLYTLTSVSLLSLTSFSLAGEKCEKGSCDKSDKVACEKGCDKDEDCSSCDSDTVKFAVTGMTCGGCSGKVKKALAATEGVTVKKVCHKSGTVAVSIDSEKTSKAKVQEAINATGFKVAGEKLDIPVSGMTCGGCSGKVKKALAAIDGCTVSGVCHKSGEAHVTIDTSKTSKEKVIEAINATGFKAGATAKKEEAPAKKG